MELYHKDRPRMGERLCYLSGKSVIHEFQVMPVDDTVARMSIMLPVAEAGSSFGFTWFRRKVRYGRIADVLESFRDDPEACLTDMFGKGGFMTPNIYPPKTQRTKITEGAVKKAPPPKVETRRDIGTRTRQRIRLED